MYKTYDALDKTIKPLILDWLSSLVGIKFQHSFRDQFINWSLYSGELNIMLDFNNKEQAELFNKLPSCIKGCLQYKTLLHVNEKTLYIPLAKILDVQYPEIVSSKPIGKTKHAGGTGGWTSPSDAFYTYDWEVFLSDNTSVHYNNQVDKMNMIKGDFSYNHIIQERAFTEFLKNLK